MSNICSEQILAVENQIDPINLEVLDEYIVKNVKRAVVATKVNNTYYKQYFIQLKYNTKNTCFQCIFGTVFPSQLPSEFSDEANNLMFSTYRFKLFLVTDS